VSKAAEKVVRKLVAEGHEAYFAGGSVRDMLLGREAKDVDVATGATPDQVQSLFPSATDLQGKAFGVVRVRSDDEVLEVATFRVDGDYKDGRRPESVTFATAEEDAQRRDFTINGLFYDPIAKKVVDFVGGQADLKKKILRAIGDPHKRFEEDSLRVFRAIRFAAQLGFEIEPATWKAICEHGPQTVRLAPERVREELVKSLTSERPGLAFDLLDASGLFRAWIPEIETLKGVEQPPQFHPEGDVFKHTRMMVHHLKHPSVVLVFSVLFHDIAKPDTFRVDPTGRIRFNEHETIGARKGEEIMKRLRFSNDEIEAVRACVANHMSFKDVREMRQSTLKRFLGRPTLEDELELHRIDCLSSHGLLDLYEFVLEKRGALSHEEIHPDPLLNGDDLISMGLRPGPMVGKILHLVREEQLEGRITSREQALGYARQVAGGYIGPERLQQLEQ
jgi:tRNA nucleotidyltransferase/poly(A) polymerase